ASTDPGVPFAITIYAIDPYGNIDTNYRGTVGFVSTDAQAELPDPYTFTDADQGVASFLVTLFTPSDQTVLAYDTVSLIYGQAIVTVDGRGAPGGAGPGGLVEALVPAAPPQRVGVRVDQPRGVGPARQDGSVVRQVESQGDRFETSRRRASAVALVLR